MMMTHRMRLFASLTTLSAALLASPARAGIVYIGSPVTANGYTFTNFDFSPLTAPATGSNANGISNTGQIVGATVDVNGAPTFTNFAGNPLTGTLTPLNTGTGQTALGINSAGNVVGGNGTNAFFLPNGGALQTLTTPATAINAFGINDNGNIVGQFTSGANTPGFILNSAASTSFTTINAPTGVTSNFVNAQGINNAGLVVGFYLGNDGQVHGFTANAPASPGTLSTDAVSSPADDSSAPPLMLRLVLAVEDADSSFCSMIMGSKSMLSCFGISTGLSSSMSVAGAPVVPEACPSAGTEPAGSSSLSSSI